MLIVYDTMEPTRAGNFETEVSYQAIPNLRTDIAAAIWRIKNFYVMDHTYLLRNHVVHA